MALYQVDRKNLPCAPLPQTFVTFIILQLSLVLGDRFVSSLPSNMTGTHILIEINHLTNCAVTLTGVGSGGYAGDLTPPTIYVGILICISP